MVQVLGGACLQGAITLLIEGWEALRCGQNQVLSFGEIVVGGANSTIQDFGLRRRHRGHRQKLGPHLLWTAVRVCLQGHDSMTLWATILMSLRIWCQETDPRWLDWSHEFLAVLLAAWYQLRLLVGERTCEGAYVLVILIGVFLGRIHLLRVPLCRGLNHWTPCGGCCFLWWWGTVILIVS